MSLIPRPEDDVLDKKTGRFTRGWRRFLEDLGGTSGSGSSSPVTASQLAFVQAQVNDLASQVDDLEGGGWQV